MKYPMRVSVLPDNSFTLRFPDVPTAVGSCFTVESIAIAGLNGLLVAIKELQRCKITIPMPSQVNTGHGISLPITVALKVLIYNAILKKGWTYSAFGKSINLSPTQMTRILDLDHHSRVDELESILKVLGIKVSMSVDDNF